MKDVLLITTKTEARTRCIKLRVPDNASLEDVEEWAEVTDLSELDGSDPHYDAYNSGGERIETLSFSESRIAHHCKMHGVELSGLPVEDISDEIPHAITKTTRRRGPHENIQADDGCRMSRENPRSRPLHNKMNDGYPFGKITTE